MSPFLTSDQITGAKFHAEKFTEAAAALSVLDEIDDSKRDVAFLRIFYLKQLKTHLEGLATDCGYRLAPTALVEVAA